MTKKPKALVLPALLVTAFLLSACGKKAPLDEPPPKEEKKRSDLMYQAPSA